MNDIKLAQYIRGHKLKYSLIGLARSTGCDTSQIQHVIDKYKLFGHIIIKYIITQFDDAITDLNGSPKKTYTIRGLALKHDVEYTKFYRYIKRSGWERKFKQGNRRNVIETDILKAMLKKHTVVEVSKFARAKNMFPHSRQGLYDLCKKFHITPLKMRKK
jgi:hypothetical protein